MEDLTQIRIPAAERWRQVRQVYLPVLVFVALVVAIVLLWRRYVAPGSIVGEVETIHANILSLADGMVQELKVDYLETVTNGQELVVVSVGDPDVLDAEVAAATADLRLMRARMDLDLTRNLDNYSRLRADLLVERLDLELARIRLRQAEAEFERTQKLLDAQIVPRGTTAERNNFGYDVALRDRDALRAEVGTREKTVAELQKGMERIQATGLIEVTPVDGVIEQAIAAETEKLQRLQEPIILRSPIDGFISGISNRPNERVLAGSPILVVSASVSDSIIAWARQPVSVRPQVGDEVEVRRKTRGAPAFRATVTMVGSQLEPIRPSALWPDAKMIGVESGLPLVVKSAKVLQLIPGEPVLIRFIRSGRGADQN